MRVQAGTLMIATGVVHNAFGLLLGLGVLPAPDGLRRNLVAAMYREGLVGTAEVDPLRMTFFWFELFGALCLLLGSLMCSVEARGQALPARLGWQLLALTLAGLLFVPASGLWLLLPQAALILLRARRACQRPGSAAS